MFGLSQDQLLQFFKRRGLLVVLSLVTIKKSLQYLHKRQANQQLKLLAAAKKQRVIQSCDHFNQHHKVELSPQLQERLLNASIKEIHQMYKLQEVTVTQVLKFFIDRTIKVGVPLNLVIETMFEQALEEAQEQDKLLQQDVNVVDKYLLFGIPASIKDVLMVKGTDTTFGLANRCFLPSPQDGYEALAFRRAKAIIFAKTNIPQLMMMSETNNIIVGRALNPANKDRSTGGSSGGEAGMIASRCSVIGIGTDTAGSLRNPAGFCGIYTIRASSVRVHGPKRHLENILVMSGLTQVQSIAGPMGKYAEDVIIAFNALNQQFNVPALVGDPFYTALPLDYQTINGNQKYRIGFVKSVDFVPAASVNQRAVSEAAKKLQEQGHTCFPLELDKSFVNKSMEIFYKLLLADTNLKGYRELLKDEYFAQEHYTFEKVSQIPKFLIKLYYQILKLKGDQRKKYIIEALKQKWTATEFIESCGVQQQLIQQLYQYFEDNQIDALILPVSAGVAFKHGESQQGNQMLVYCLFLSLFNFSIGVAPITHVREDEQFYPQYYNDLLEKSIQNNMRDSINLPVGVQIVTKPHYEEVCLKIMKCLDDQFINL